MNQLSADPVTPCALRLKIAEGTPEKAGEDARRADLAVALSWGTREL